MTETTIHLITHFLAGYAICFTLQFGLPDKPVQLQFVPMGVAALAGVAKEASDEVFDMHEMEATIAGGITAFLVYKIIETGIRPLWVEDTKEALKKKEAFLCTIPKS